ncbi:hypothetical protein CDAR_314091 [Caerostris darwini]|uniref:Uncharacterized protein n=1 Tax=Caerostris darwini TaxID=1538125 RepID=A0AAV4MXS1_9ARAC|nr:hypothetical protein CDAR_314091 [Caerostris darwini]
MPGIFLVSTPLQYNPILLVTQDVTAYKRYIIIGYLKVYFIAIFLYYVPNYEEAYGPTSCQSSHANDPTVGSPTPHLQSLTPNKLPAAGQTREFKQNPKLPEGGTEERYLSC